MEIKQLVESKKVFLFMKGTPDFPQCGFSAKVVDILRELKIEFAYFDILSDETVRQACKVYANWPTIPQLYIKGQFIGGCDIAVQLAESGELAKLVA